MSDCESEELHFLMSQTNQSIDEIIKPMVIASYSLVTALAVAGNFAVLLIIYRFPSMRSEHNIRPNLLIGNLALADLLMAIFCIPFSYWPMLLLEYGNTVFSRVN